MGFSTLNENSAFRDNRHKQVAFGGNDFAIDGFHIDTERRNFYLLQFKWSEDHAQFKTSFKRLIEDGMERLFAADGQVQGQNQLLLKLKSRLLHDQNLIDRRSWKLLMAMPSGSRDRCVFCMSSKPS